MCRFHNQIRNKSYFKNTEKLTYLKKIKIKSVLLMQHSNGCLKNAGFSVGKGMC